MCFLRWALLKYNRYLFQGNSCFNIKQVFLQTWGIQDSTSFLSNVTQIEVLKMNGQGGLLKRVTVSVDQNYLQVILS